MCLWCYGCRKGCGLWGVGLAARPGGKDKKRNLMDIWRATRWRKDMPCSRYDRVIYNVGGVILSGRCLKICLFDLQTWSQDRNYQMGCFLQSLSRMTIRCKFVSTVVWTGQVDAYPFTRPLTLSMQWINSLNRVTPAARTSLAQLWYTTGKKRQVSLGCRPQVEFLCELKYQPLCISCGLASWCCPLVSRPTRGNLSPLCNHHALLVLTPSTPF